MLETLIEYLQSLGFMVQATSFEDIIEDELFKETVLTTHQYTKMAKLLIAFPTLFIIHKEIQPQKCAIMMKVINDHEKLRKAHIEIYKVYYPPQTAIVCLGPTIETCTAGWVRKCLTDVGIDKSKMIRLTTFLNRLLSAKKVSKKHSQRK